MSRILLVAFVLSQALMSFAHAHGHSSPEATSVHNSAYVLPDGSMPVICFTEATHELDVSHDCEMCSLVKAVLSGGGVGYHFSLVGSKLAGLSEAVFVQSFALFSSARGPPVS